MVTHASPIDDDDGDDDDRRREDDVIVLRGATWADYLRLLRLRGESSAPRIAYKQGVVQIMSPSLDHERIKSFIGRLVEAFCFETGVEFTPAGSWTLKDRKEDSGVEADECYVFGVPTRKPKRPHLAIEVQWSRGRGVNKLPIYAALDVREVWIWNKGVITPWVLTGRGYKDRDRSRVLPGIDLVELARFVDSKTGSEAVRRYRLALQKRAKRSR